MQQTQTIGALDAYFEHIGYRGPRTPTLETLAAIQAHHTRAIPFENLTPFLKQPVVLEIPALIEKIVHGGRGGYCFEHNFLLRYALREIGFAVTGLAARVRWNVPDDVTTARGHMLLRIDLGGETYFVDAGFGGLTTTAPVRLALDIEQPTPHEPVRLVAAGPAYRLQALVDGEWKTLYQFDLHPQEDIDYGVTSWYLSNHPASHFVTTLIAARPAEGRRYALRGNQYAVHHLGGPTERRTMATVAELRETLQSDFLIKLPDTPGLDAALARALA